jgi:hypothetical protein
VAPPFAGAELLTTASNALPAVISDYSAVPDTEKRLPSFEDFNPSGRFFERPALDGSKALFDIATRASTARHSELPRGGNRAVFLRRMIRAPHDQH